MTGCDASSSAGDSAARPDHDGPEIGRAYRQVVELRPDLRVGRKEHLTVIFAGDDQVHLDLEGRLHRAWLDGISYQRGLDGRMRGVRIDRPDPKERWLEIVVVGRDEGRTIIERANGILAEAADALRALPGGGAPAISDAAGDDAAGDGEASDGDDLTVLLARAADWSLERYAAEAERFDRIYDPIPILPPDQNRALVLQATAGCSWNRCTFCHLYHDTQFRAHPPDAFRAHVRGVVELVGRALPLRRGVFIGQANALCIGQHKLRAAIDVIRDELGDATHWPLASFIDSFTRRPTLDELRELRRLGLQSVALGLESGSAAVLDCLGKPAEVGDAVALVRELGEAGITRGIIVLVGAGGSGLATEHVDETVRAITDMRLGRRDRIYLSPLHVIDGSEYERRVGERGLGVLAPEELRAQAGELRDRLRAAGVTANIALYDIRRFIY
jgi:hypothetical protein